jgi:excisionase family DNA binding protein
MTSRSSNRRQRSSSASRTTGAGTQIRPIGKLHTIDELAELWDVSRRTLQRAIKSGALRVHRIGRLVRIAEADAAAFLDENRYG